MICIYQRDVKFTFITSNLWTNYCDGCHNQKWLAKVHIYIDGMGDAVLYQFCSQLDIVNCDILAVIVNKRKHWTMMVSIKSQLQTKSFAILFLQWFDVQQHLLYYLDPMGCDSGENDIDLLRYDTPYLDALINLLVSLRGQQFLSLHV